MVAAIESAIASLAESLPDAALEMRHGEDSGTVLASSSRELSGDTVSADAPQEMRRFVGKRIDFPELAKGACVYIGGVCHIVTGARTDPVGASVSIGVSSPLEEFRASYRRPGTQIRQPMDVLAVESETLDAWGDNFAPTSCRAWFVAFPAEDWFEVSEPQVGDELTLDNAVLRVASVSKRDGHWLLTCRARRSA